MQSVVGPEIKITVEKAKVILTEWQKKIDKGVYYATLYKWDGKFFRPKEFFKKVKLEKGGH